MQLKTNVEVNHEEVLARLEPEEILIYLQKNHPSFCEQKIRAVKSIQKYPIGQWFRKEGGLNDEMYYLASYMKGSVYLIGIDFKNGGTNRWNDVGFECIDFCFTIKDIHQSTQFIPIDFKDIPK